MLLMQVYQSRYGKISGTDVEVVAKARREYRHIQKLTPKRRPYVRSRYFKRDKVFVGIFWSHLAQKHYGEQTKRLRYYPCAIDLLRNMSRGATSIISQKEADAILYRFCGESKEGLGFYVQVKQDKRSGRKDLISIFPARKK